MNPREATITAIVLSVLIYVGLSFALTGKPFSDINTITRSITHQRYNIHFCINDAGWIILPDVSITDVKITPLRIGTLDIFKSIECGWLGFKGYAEIEVKRAGTEDVIYRERIENIQICEGEKICFDRVFAVDGSDDYKITIWVFNEKSELADVWDTTSYLRDKGD